MTRLVFTTATCRCGNAVPVKVAQWIVDAASEIPGETVLLDYRCRKCGVVVITVAHLAGCRKAA